MKEAKKEKCSACGQTISQREIGLYQGLVIALWKVWKWVQMERKTEFSRKMVKHLFDSENDTARFGDWVLFGGILCRPQGKNKGWYRFNEERTEQFFGGKLKIPTLIVKNPVTNELKLENYKTVYDVPSIMEYLNSDAMWVAQYRPPSPKQEVGQLEMGV